MENLMCPFIKQDCVKEDCALYGDEESCSLKNIIYLNDTTISEFHAQLDNNTKKIIDALAELKDSIDVLQGYLA